MFIKENIWGKNRFQQHSMVTGKPLFLFWKNSLMDNTDYAESINTKKAWLGKQFFENLFFWMSGRIFTIEELYNILKQNAICSFIF